METKIFGNKKITIRKIIKLDLKNIKKFQAFINSFIIEDAKLSINKKVSPNAQKEFLKKTLDGMKNKSKVYIVAESDNKIIGASDIELLGQRRNHIGSFGIAVKAGYRGVGLGKYLMSEIIMLAKKELNPKPEIIQLEVYANNKPAINLYKKMGFKICAKLPKQVQWKRKLIPLFVMIKFL